MVRWALNVVTYTCEMHMLNSRWTFSRTQCSKYAVLNTQSSSENFMCRCTIIRVMSISTTPNPRHTGVIDEAGKECSRSSSCVGLLPSTRPTGLWNQRSEKGGDIIIHVYWHTQGHYCVGSVHFILIQAHIHVCACG